MGFFASLFGGNKQDKALRDAFAHIRRLLDDEAFQLEFMHPMMRETLKSAPAYDKAPDGTGPFGFVETNPIPVNGPLGELAYLSRLETASGKRILFHRLGSIGKIDVFEAVTFDGKEWFVFFLDFYHPRRSRCAPDGFKIADQVAQFSGFHRYCENFPYDFVQKKEAENASGLSMAYIPIGRVAEQINSRAYSRPLAHSAKIDLLRTRLSGFLKQ